jgi:hypothetical protein
VESYPNLFPVGGNSGLAANNNNSDGNSTLPLPELNPLLNPVLAAHMGQWAEVYFTAPPEKREEAVLELLRELQGGTATARRATGEPEKTVPRPAKLPPEAAPVRQVQPEWIVCESCGGRNIPGNRFCGMCAEPLEREKSASSEPSTAPPGGILGGLVERNPEPGDRLPTDPMGDRHESDPAQSSRSAADPHEQDFDLDPEFDSREFDSLDEHVTPREYAEPVDEPRAWPQNNWPARPDVPSLIPAYDETPNRRRMYLGVVVGVLILGLLYVAWKGSAARSVSSRQLPQSAPATTETQPATSSESSFPAPQAETGQASTARPSTTQPSTNQASTTQASTTQASTTQGVLGPHPVQTSRPLRRRSDAGTNLNAVTPAATSDQSPEPIVAPLLGNGSEELAVAESYLNGTRGKTRDTSEAAKWLWRSFGKKNGAAALLLSDLYVRGDGVPQSCDQARLLLDTATRKGTAGAVERLQNLPARGCP